MNSSSIALAYMKGIVDSEGNYDTYRLRITNTSIELINWLRKNFGGNVCEQKWSKMTKHQAYQWSLNRKDTAELMPVLPNHTLLFDEEKKAYIAGLIDGDGTIYLHKRTRNSHQSVCPRVIITSSGSGLAEYVYSAYGGSMSTVQPRKGYREKKPYTYLLIAGSKRAGSMIRDMLPYLLIKKDRAQEVLSCLN